MNGMRVVRPIFVEIGDTSKGASLACLPVSCPGSWRCQVGAPSSQKSGEHPYICYLRCISAILPS